MGTTPDHDTPIPTTAAVFPTNPRYPNVGAVIWRVHADERLSSSIHRPRDTEHIAFGINTIAQPPDILYVWYRTDGVPMMLTYYFGTDFGRG